jgi:hypothetical protein
MSCDEELLRIATSLNRHPYFSSWNINILRAFIRDRGLCVYCGRLVLGTHNTDHLPPKNKYRRLADDVCNLVPSCAVCNSIKQDYDPCGGAEPETIDENLRLRLIARAKEYVEKERKAWEGELQEATPHFQKAVVEYRECLRRQASE